MNKPIEDWTIGEVKKYCTERSRCGDCEFVNGNVCSPRCVLRENAPSAWNLSKRNWTDSEVLLADLLYTKTKCDTLFHNGTFIEVKMKGEQVFTFPDAMFPSMKKLETFRIVDIVKEKRK